MSEDKLLGVIFRTMWRDEIASGEPHVLDEGIARGMTNLFRSGLLGRAPLVMTHPERDARGERAVQLLTKLHVKPNSRNPFNPMLFLSTGEALQISSTLVSAFFTCAVAFGLIDVVEPQEPEKPTLHVVGGKES